MMSLSGSSEGTTFQRSRGSERNEGDAVVCDFGGLVPKKKETNVITMFRCED